MDKSKQRLACSVEESSHQGLALGFVLSGGNHVEQVRKQLHCFGEASEPFFTIEYLLKL